MRKILITLILIFFSFDSYCQHPYKQNLQDIATITFPDTPKTKIISAETFYYFHDKGSTYICEAMPLSTSLSDILKGNSIDSLYTVFINSALAPTKSHTFYKNNIIANDLKGVEFGFKFQAKGRTCYSYQNVFYLNDVLINYSYLSLDSLNKNDKRITDFFKTFKLTIKKEEIRQSNAAELGHITAYIFMAFVIIGIIALFGFGIVFIIRKVTYKKS